MLTSVAGRASRREAGRPHSPGYRKFTTVWSRPARLASWPAMALWLTLLLPARAAHPASSSANEGSWRAYQESAEANSVTAACDPSRWAHSSESTERLPDPNTFLTRSTVPAVKPRPAISLSSFTPPAASRPATASDMALTSITPPPFPVIPIEMPACRPDRRARDRGSKVTRSRRKESLYTLDWARSLRAALGLHGDDSAMWGNAADTRI